MLYLCMYVRTYMDFFLELSNQVSSKNNTFDFQHAKLHTNPPVANYYRCAMPSLYTYHHYISKLWHTIKMNSPVSLFA